MINQLDGWTLKSVGLGYGDGYGYGVRMLAKHMGKISLRLWAQGTVYSSVTVTVTAERLYTWFWTYTNSNEKRSPALTGL